MTNPSPIDETCNFLSCLDDPRHPEPSTIERFERLEREISEGESLRQYSKLLRSEAVQIRHEALASDLEDPDFATYQQQVLFREMRPLLTGEPSSGNAGRRQFPRQPQKWKKGSRESYLRVGQAFKIIEASHYASLRGLHLSSELTISFKDLGHTEDETIKQCFEIFLDRFRSWHRHYGAECAYVYVVERSADMGLHVHMAFHLADKRHGNSNRFTLFRAWSKETISSLAIGESRGKSVTQPYLVLRNTFHAERVRRWIQYLLKGMSPHVYFNVENGPFVAAEIMGIPTFDQGHIPFKRSGVSHSLGEASRRSRGYGSFFRLDRLHDWNRLLWVGKENGCFLMPPVLVSAGQPPVRKGYTQRDFYS